MGGCDARIASSYGSAISTRMSRVLMSILTPVTYIQTIKSQSQTDCTTVGKAVALTATIPAVQVEFEEAVCDQL